MEHLPEHLKGVVACGFLCGMRKSEILGLTWDRVDLRGRTLRLEGRHTKSGMPRRIPMPDELVKILMALPSRLSSAQDPEAPVFTFRGQPIVDMRTGLVLACEKAGIPYGREVKRGFVFHDLRHSYVTHARKSGMAESVIMAIVGHTSRSMLDRYNLVDADDLEAATKQLEDYFQAAL
jgi:integrase